MTNRHFLNSLLLSMTFIFSLSSAQAATRIECSADVHAQSGSGQQFNIHDTLTLDFDSQTLAYLKFYTNAGNGDQLDDQGAISTTGSPYPNTPGYVIYKGKDRMENGFLYLAMPENPLNETGNFDVQFMTTQTDFGTSKPVRFPLGTLNCVRK